MLPFRPQQRKKVWASILSSWPAKLCSKLAASNASLTLCLEGSGKCLTWLDSQESTKMFVRDCGTWQPRWKIWPPRSARIHHFATSTSMTHCSLTPSMFLERLLLYNAQKLHSKLANGGEHCMFVGYASNQTGNTFKMLNLNAPDLEVKRC